MKRFYYGRQNIDEDDIKAVVDVLRSDIITQGRVVRDFEEALAKYCGSRYAVACSSGTAALHLSYLATGLSAGDALITSANTFASTANAALFTGATPVFSDIDPKTYNMNAETLIASLSRVPENMKLKAVVPVHFAGLPIDIESISNAAKESGASVIIEDACHALGAKWKSSNGQERKVGDCAFSDLTVFSFHPVKAITTGEGGAITTNDRALYDKLLLYRSHGITKEADKFVSSAKQDPVPSWYYEMQELGQNYRITDFQCALGISQLKKLDGFLEERKMLASQYDKLFRDCPSITRRRAEDRFFSANHLYVIEIAFKESGIDKALWFNRMSEMGINLQVHYIPLHLQPYYKRRFNTGLGQLPHVEDYYDSAVSLPIYPGLRAEDVDFIASSIIDSLTMNEDKTGAL